MILSYGEKHIGNKKVNNDDSFYFSDFPLSLYVVADGMSGYSGGKIASSICVDTVVDIVSKHKYLDESIFNYILKEIVQKLMAEIEKDNSLSDMGSTLLCCLITENKLKCVNIGDSRAYIVKDASIEQITEDDTLVNILYKNGVIKEKDLKNHKYRHKLSKAVSVNLNESAEILTFDFNEGDYLLLCSDGLTDSLTNSQILKEFNDFKEPEDITKRLIKRALEEGGHDNVTVVVVRG